MQAFLLNILQKIDKQLIEKSAFSPEFFQEQLVFKYQDDLLRKLKSILDIPPINDNEKINNQLTIVLQKNWQLIQGTALCYTACPEDPVTILICDIAEYLSTTSPKTPAIHFLMPGINIEWFANEPNPFPLVKPEKPESNNKPSSRANDESKSPEWSLQHILKTHILSSSRKYLIPISRFPELIGFPDFIEKPKRFNRYFDYQTMEDKDAIISEKEIFRIQMHSKITEDFFHAYQCLRSLKDTQNHLLAQLERLCLVMHLNGAQHRGQEKDASGDVYPAIIRFSEYYGLLSKQQKNKIPVKVRQEIDLIIELSSNPKKNFNATENLQTCIASRREELLPPIKKHQETLKNIGLQDKAGQQLIKQKFKELENQKQNLIQLIKGQKYTGKDTLGYTKKLLNQFNVKIKIDSLLVLKDVLTSNFKDLQTLLQDETVKKQIQNQLDSLDTLVWFLHDHPDSHINLLIEYSREHITKPLDIAALLMTFDLTRCESIIEALKISGILSKVIKSTEHLSTIFEVLTTEQRALIFKNMEDRLPEMTIGKISKLNALLNHLTIEQTQIVITAMKSSLFSILSNGKDLYRLLQYLSTEQQAIIFKTIEKKLPLIHIESAYLLNIILKIFSIEQAQIMLRSMKDTLPFFLNNGADLSRLLYNLSHEKRNLVFESLKDILLDKINQEFSGWASYYRLKYFYPIVYLQSGELPFFFKHARDLELALMHLSNDQRMMVIEAIKTMLPTLTRTTDDLTCILPYLNLEQFKEFLLTEHGNLPYFINNSSDLNHVFKNISEEKRQLLYQDIKYLIPPLIMRGYDICSAFKFLTKTQREEIFAQITRPFSNLIQDPRELTHALKNLTPELCKTATLNILASSKAFYIDSDWFKYTMSRVPHKNRKAIFETLKNYFPSLIENARDFRIVLSNLTIKQCQEVVKIIQASLPSLITNVQDLKNIFNCNTLEKFNLIMEAIGCKKINLIKNGEDFNNICHFLDSKKHQIIIETIKNRLSHIIKNCVDLNLVLKCLNAKERNFIFVRMKKIIPQWIHSADDLNLALEFMTPKQQCLIINKVQNTLMRTIRNGFDINLACQFMSPNQRAMFFKKIKNFPNLLHSGDDLSSALQFFSTEQRSIVFSDIKADLPFIIKDAGDLSRTFSYLTPVQRDEVIQIMRTEIPNLIKSDADLKCVTKHLNKNQSQLIAQIYQSQRGLFVNIGSNIYSFIANSLPRSNREIDLRNLPDLR